nr:hypothetical protein GCM10020093_096340 [Planobispora longispora]
MVWGRCWDGTGAPPFWPWTQAVQELAGVDGGLGRLAGSGRFELYEAFAGLLNEHGRVLVVLDDLQWADASSLRLLEFLATTRLCPGLTVVATYRDTDVRPGGALEQALGTLVRLPHARRLLLRGLGEAEIRQYLDRAGADPERAAEMAGLTAGNPFFLGEILHLGETPGLCPTSCGGGWPACRRRPRRCSPPPPCSAGTRPPTSCSGWPSRPRSGCSTSSTRRYGPGC